MGEAITLDVIAFIALACAFAVYGLYASAAALRDPGTPHLSLGAVGTGAFPDAGVAAAGFAAIGFFLMPWLARVGGYPATATALIGISVPLAAVLVGFRGWAVARLFGAHGSGELLARNYGSTVAVLAGVIVAAAAMILLSLVLVTAGSLIHAMSAGVVSQPVALNLAALVLALTGAPAGIRAAGKLARLHTWLVVLGAGAAITLVVARLGGIDALVDALATVASPLGWGSTGGRGGGDYNLALAVAGAVGSGTVWTGTTILSVQVAVGGTLLVLVWMPWALASADARRLHRQTGIGGALGSGLLMAGALILGIAGIAIEPATIAAPFVPFSGQAPAGDGIGLLLDALAGERLWGAAVLLGLGGGAALHAVSLSLLAAAVGALRPIWMRRNNSPRGSARDLGVSQGTATALVVGAALIALLPADEFAVACTLAVSFAPLAALPFAAACWFPKLTRGGMVAGLSLGAAVVALETFTAEVAVHAALSGLATASIVAVAISLARPADSKLGLRLEAHRTLAEILVRPSDERGPDHGRRNLALLAVLLWTFFAIGPGIVIGNDLFGAPDLPSRRWDFSIPSIAVWQLLSWASGIGLIWLLGRSFGMADLTRAQLGQISARRDRKIGDR